MVGSVADLNKLKTAGHENPHSMKTPLSSAASVAPKSATDFLRVLHVLTEFGFRLNAFKCVTKS